MTATIRTHLYTPELVYSLLTFICNAIYSYYYNFVFIYFKVVVIVVYVVLSFITCHLFVRQHFTKSIRSYLENILFYKFRNKLKI